MRKEIVFPLEFNALAEVDGSSSRNHRKGTGTKDILSFDDSGYIFLHNFLKPYGSCFPMRANVRTHFQSSDQSLQISVNYYRISTFLGEYLSSQDQRYS
jgi:hypothetical protein